MLLKKAYEVAVLELLENEDYELTATIIIKAMALEIAEKRVEEYLREVAKRGDVD